MIEIAFSVKYSPDYQALKSVIYWGYRTFMFVWYV